MNEYTGGIRHDYKDKPASGQRLRLSRGWLLFALSALAPIAAALVLVSDPVQSTEGIPAEPARLAADPEGSAQPVNLSILSAAAASETPPLVMEPLTAAEPPLREHAMLDLVVNRGDSLDRLFRRNNLRLADLAAMLEIPGAAEPLRRLLPGDTLSITHDDGRVLALARPLNDSETLRIERAGDNFNTRVIEHPVERRVVGRHGVIRTSLFEAGMAASIPDAVTMAMAGLFEWDIDFMLDVREGDSFTLLYEERWRDDERLGSGNIIAAEFINRGNVTRIARYTDPEGRTGYFTPDGRSVRKAFVRAPLVFTRISGNFNPNRRHPILNTIRAHRGVDYAAPSGTPVKAAGDGKIIERGPNGGYGNAVVIQHGNNITTLYAHLSRFAAPKLGSRVSQGDVIGYVGQTGLATGPHLHYEYRVNGVHRNPRTVELPAADPVADSLRADFQRAATALWQQLDAYKSPFLANVQN